MRAVSRLASGLVVVIFSGFVLVGLVEVPWQVDRLDARWYPEAGIFLDAEAQLLLLG
jgi:hypothetical protein